MPGLTPAMVNAGNQLLQAARSIDRRFRMTSGYRSTRQQQALFAAWLRRGRTGLPVAPPGASLHEQGLAIDISRGLDPFRDPALAALGKWWIENGLGWSPSDPVHFQLPALGDRNPLALDTSDERSPEMNHARSALRSMGPPIDPDDRFSVVRERQREALEDYRARLAIAVPAGSTAAAAAVGGALGAEAASRIPVAGQIPGVAQLGAFLGRAIGEVFGGSSAPLIDVTTGQQLQASREAMLAMGAEYRTRKLQRLADGEL